MRILGVDPGLSLTGFGCLEFPGGDVALPARVADAGVIRLPSKQTVSHRLAMLERELSALVEELRPSYACVESVFSHVVHPRTAIVMGHARGVILLVIERSGVPLIELPPAEVKKSLTGSGRASKEQMQRAIAGALGLSAPPQPADVADALAVALAGSVRLHASEAMGPERVALKERGTDGV